MWFQNGNILIGQDLIVCYPELWEKDKNKKQKVLLEQKIFVCLGGFLFLVYIFYQTNFLLCFFNLFDAESESS